MSTNHEASNNDCLGNGITERLTSGAVAIDSLNPRTLIPEALFVAQRLFVSVSPA